jgi:hypothetical protein
MRFRKAGLVCAVFLGMFFLTTSEARAFEFKVTKVTTWKPPQKGVDASGTYALGANESLLAVYIQTFSATGAQLTTAQGTINSRTTWSAGCGDYQMVSWRIWYKVKFGNATNNYYSTTYKLGTGP